MANSSPILSIIVPVYNERAGLHDFHQSLLHVLEKIAPNAYEIIYCDDGSTDDPGELIESWHTQNRRIKLVTFSRNFGKEYALSAGLAEARGQAIMMIDGDGQHPVELIPKFIAEWKAGAQVVIGVRTDNNGEGLVKNLGSKIFNYTFKRLTGQDLLSGSTDFRLIDRAVQKAFLKLKENDRLTRSLIDWLGFKRRHIPFQAKARMHGTAGYSIPKLARTALDSYIAATAQPLYIFGYLGVCITAGAFLLGGAVIIEQLIIGDPLHWKFTGTAMLGILILFLVGVVLMSQAVVSLYVANIQSQSRRRPLYIIDYSRSVGVKDDNTDE